MMGNIRLWGQSQHQMSPRSSAEKWTTPHRNTSTTWNSNTVFEKKVWDLLHSFAKYIVSVQSIFYLYVNKIYTFRRCISLWPKHVTLDNLTLLFRTCSRDPTHAIANRLKEMHELYSQHFQPDEDSSNCAKGKVYCCPDCSSLRRLTTCSQTRKD